MKNSVVFALLLLCVCCIADVVEDMMDDWAHHSGRSLLQIQQKVAGSSIVANLSTPSQVVYSCGANLHGQLGIGNRDPQQHGQPLLSVIPHNISVMSAGGGHVLALDEAGTFYVWGANAAGQLGLGDLTLRLSPTIHPLAVLNSEDAIAASIGLLENGHSLAVSQTYSVYAWGSNSRGELGLGNKATPVLTPTISSRLEPTCLNQLDGSGQATDLTTHVMIVAAAGHHSLALDNGGRLFSWGWDSNGQLGFGEYWNSLEDITTPTLSLFFQCPKMSDADVVSSGTISFAGDSVTIYLNSDAPHAITVNYFVGMYIFFTSGSSIGQTHKIKQHSSDPTGVFVVLETALDSCAIAEDQSQFEIRATCNQVVLTAIATGNAHSMGLDDSGALWVWGDNSMGQLCAGTTGKPNMGKYVTPFKVDFSKTALATGTFSGKITSISAGLYHNLALTDSGILLSWGDNRHGQLGRSNVNGLFDSCSSVGGIQVPVPAQTAAPPIIDTFDAGSYHSVVSTRGIFPHRTTDNAKELLVTQPSMGQAIIFGSGAHGQGCYGQSDFPLPHAVRQLENATAIRAWAGRDASYFQIDMMRCSSQCSGHGTCDPFTARCTCNQPWTLEVDCLTARCPLDCSGHGRCDNYAAVCLCDAGYVSANCSIALCPNNCNGADHGTCDVSTGTCVCVANATMSFLGFDCFVPNPLHVIDPVQFFTQQSLRLAPFFVSGKPRTLLDSQQTLIFNIMTGAACRVGAGTVLAVVVSVVVAIAVL